MVAQTLHTNLVGDEITCVASGEYHMRRDLDELADVVFNIHTVTLKEGEPYFYAVEQKPLGGAWKRNLEGFVSGIGSLYRLL